MYIPIHVHTNTQHKFYPNIWTSKHRLFHKLGKTARLFFHFFLSIPLGHYIDCVFKMHCLALAGRNTWSKKRSSESSSSEVISAIGYNLLNQSSYPIKFLLCAQKPDRVQRDAQGIIKGLCISQQYQALSRLPVMATHCALKHPTQLNPILPAEFLLLSKILLIANLRLHRNHTWLEFFRTTATNTRNSCLFTYKGCFSWKYNITSLPRFWWETLNFTLWTSNFILFSLHFHTKWLFWAKLILQMHISALNKCYLLFHTSPLYNHHLDTPK